MIRLFPIREIFSGIKETSQADLGQPGWFGWSQLWGGGACILPFSVYPLQEDNQDTQGKQDQQTSDKQLGSAGQHTAHV